MSRPVSPKCAWLPIEAVLADRALSMCAAWSSWNSRPVPSARAYAEILGVTRRTINRYRASGFIPLRQVEQLAERLGKHPTELADDYYEAVAA